MNVYFQEVSVCCLLPHYLSLNNLTWVDKARSTQSNYSRTPLKSQEYKTTLRYFGDPNILLELKDLDFCWVFFLFDWKEARKIQLVQSDSTLEKDLLPIFFSTKKDRSGKKPNLFNCAKCVCLLLKSAQPKSYKLVSGGRKGHKKKTTWLAFQ